MAEAAMKRAFIVLGPESSGNRLVTRILIAAGCYGDGTDGKQRLDVEIPRDQELLVWLRSLPHGGKWPDVAIMVRQLRDAGFLGPDGVSVVLCTRDWMATLCSQIVVGHVRETAEGLMNIRRAYHHAMQSIAICALPYVMWSYEAMIARPQEYVDAMLMLCGLVRTGNVEKIIDGNAKWYGEAM